MSSLSEFFIVIGLIILLWFAWFATNGPERFRDSQGLFLSDSSSDTGNSSRFPWNRETHPYSHSIDIETGGAYSDTPNTEYISISLAWGAPENLHLTGWTIQNSQGEREAIGFGTKEPRQGSLNGPEDIILSPGDTALITTGRSPIGISFGVNICSGYIGTLQTFTPNLSTPCPSALDMARAQGIEINSRCETALRRVPLCTTYTGRVSGDVSDSCEEFLRNDINYNTCVRTYDDTYNFDEREWRIFLGRNTELWNNEGDTISLYDEKGEFVTSVSY